MSRSSRTLDALPSLLVLLLLVVAANASAQDWGDESDDWGAPSSPAPRATALPG